MRKAPNSSHQPTATSIAHAADEPGRDLLLYLALLAGPAPRAYEVLDIRWRTAQARMAQRFVPARRLADAARLIERLAGRGDVSVGVALRTAGKGGGAAAIRGAHLLHLDLDHAPREHDLATSELSALASFAIPSVEIASGGVGRRHFYWQLSQRVDGRLAQAANRRLALHLGGDLAAVDLARLLRPPSSLNHRYEPPRRVRLLAYREQARYTLTELAGALPRDPKPRHRPAAQHRGRARGRTQLDRQLAAIPAERYVHVLAGLTPNSAGKVLCPLHTETRPSMQLYPHGHLHCYGCGFHRTIIAFAAAPQGVSTRGRDFLVLREQLARTFGLRPVAFP